VRSCRRQAKKKTGDRTRPEDSLRHGAPPRPHHGLHGQEEEESKEVAALPAVKKILSFHPSSSPSHVHHYRCLDRSPANSKSHSPHARRLHFEQKEEGKKAKEMAMNREGKGMR